MEAGERVLTARDIDVLYQETDRLYYEVARGCGISESAYWVLYAVLDADEPRTQAQIAEDHSLSRQTVSSSVRALEQRQLVRLDYAEGSRRDKVVVLTKEGQDFCVRYVKPAMEAERRAFASLGKADQQAFVRTARAYADAVDRELGKLREEWGNAGGGEA
jgi:DNA-binding MarR family transcriptional regulator